MFLVIAYAAVTKDIPSYTPREISILIISIFPGFYLLMITRIPKKALGHKG